MSNIYIQEPPTNGKVLLITSVGDIDIELWSKEAPRACRNFVQLCMEGYYDGTIFHRVISGFIAQGGDPTGTGHGGESIYGHPFKDEVHSRLRFVRRGLVAMANGGPNDNGSQFFFTLGTTPELMNKHTIFGKVSGNTVFNMLKLQECETDSEDRPVHPNKILRTQILANPYDDIIPRVLKRKKDADADKKPKSKSKATKNFKLLSFGEEAEEDEEQVMKVTEGWKGKSKSSHDLTNDPRLSAVPVMEMQEPPQKKVKEEKKADDKKLDDKKSGRWDRSPEKADDKQLEDTGSERSEDKKTVDKRSGRWDKSPERSDNKNLDDIKLEISDDKNLDRSDDKRSERSADRRSDDRRSDRSDDKRAERSDERRSERSDDKRSERSDDKRSERSDDRRSERSDDRRSERADDRRSERADDRRSERADDRRPERSEERRSGDRRSDERRSERSEDKRSEERSLETKKSDEKRSDEKRKEDKRLSEKRPTMNSDEEPEESREREEQRETIRKKLKRDVETVDKEKRGEKVENTNSKPLSKSDELKQEARQLKKEIRESKKREEQRKAGNDENKTDPDDVPPSSNDPLADFKRERQKYKNLRKQQGVKGQSREDITLSLLEKFKNKLNSAKTLAGDYSDEEEEKGLEEEDDASDLSWMHHKLHFDDKHHKVLDANVTDVERYEIFDPRNPLTKRRRDESKKSLKDKR